MARRCIRCNHPFTGQLAACVACGAPASTLADLVSPVRPTRPTKKTPKPRSHKEAKRGTAETDFGRDNDPVAS